MKTVDALLLALSNKYSSISLIEATVNIKEIQSCQKCQFIKCDFDACIKQKENPQFHNNRVCYSAVM